jgi:hypothetical protein
MCDALMVLHAVQGVLWCVGTRCLLVPCASIRSLLLFEATLWGTAALGVATTAVGCLRAGGLLGKPTLLVPR